MKCSECKKILVDDNIEECDGVICCDCAEKLYPKELEICINRTKMNFKGDDKGIKEVILEDEDDN